MDHIGIDVHKKESQICILAEGGELFEQRIRTEPDRFATVLGARPRGRTTILDAIGRQLLHEPLKETRHRKPLRPNPVAP